MKGLAHIIQRHATGIAAVLFSAALILSQIGCSMDDCTRCGDVEPPRIESTFPADGDSNIAVDTTVTATFSKLMDPLTVSASSFTLEGPGGPVGATVSLDGLTATLTPLAQLAAQSVYTALIDGDVSDVTGNRIGVPCTWSFTTGAP